jgi:hypothetical protein
MNSYNKTRLQTYETGWVTLLVEMELQRRREPTTLCAELPSRLSMRPIGSEGDGGTRDRARGPGGSKSPPARTPPSTGGVARLIY